jgi:hypothetical protein
LKPELEPGLSSRDKTGILFFIFLFWKKNGLEPGFKWQLTVGFRPGYPELALGLVSRTGTGA